MNARDVVLNIPELLQHIFVLLLRDVQKEDCPHDSVCIHDSCCTSGYLVNTFARVHLVCRRWNASANFVRLDRIYRTACIRMRLRKDLDSMNFNYRALCFNSIARETYVFNDVGPMRLALRHAQRQLVHILTQPPTDCIYEKECLARRDLQYATGKRFPNGVLITAPRGEGKSYAITAFVLSALGSWPGLAVCCISACGSNMRRMLKTLTTLAETRDLPVTLNFEMPKENPNSFEVRRKYTSESGQAKVEPIKRMLVVVDEPWFGEPTYLGKCVRRAQLLSVPCAILAVGTPSAAIGHPTALESFHLLRDFVCIHLEKVHAITTLREEITDDGEIVIRYEEDVPPAWKRGKGFSRGRAPPRAVMG